VQGVPDQKDPKKQPIYFLRRLPRNPLNPDSTLAAAATWGKRSYESPPDEPKEGDDVFDVYALSPARGLNGQLYRDW
jgi:general secretion pathway protein G